MTETINPESHLMNTQPTPENMPPQADESHRAAGQREVREAQLSPEERNWWKGYQRRHTGLNADDFTLTGSGHVVRIEREEPGEIQTLQRLVGAILVRGDRSGVPQLANHLYEEHRPFAHPATESQLRTLSDEIGKLMVYLERDTRRDLTRGQRFILEQTVHGPIVHGRRQLPKTFARFLDQVIEKQPGFDRAQAGEAMRYALARLATSNKDEEQRILRGDD